MLGLKGLAQLLCLLHDGAEAILEELIYFDRIDVLIRRDVQGCDIGVSLPTAQELIRQAKQGHPRARTAEGEEYLSPSLLVDRLDAIPTTLPKADDPIDHMYHGHRHDGGDDGHQHEDGVDSGRKDLHLVADP